MCLLSILFPGDAQLSGRNYGGTRMPTLGSKVLIVPRLFLFDEL